MNKDLLPNSSLTSFKCSSGHSHAVLRWTNSFRLISSTGTFCFLLEVFISQNLFILCSLEVGTFYSFLWLLYTAGTNPWRTSPQNTQFIVQWLPGHGVFFIIKLWTVLFPTLSISQKGMTRIITQTLNHLEGWRKCNFLGKGSWRHVPPLQWIDNGGRKVWWAAPAGLLLTLYVAVRDERPESYWVTWP